MDIESKLNYEIDATKSIRGVICIVFTVNFVTALDRMKIQYNRRLPIQVIILPSIEILAPGYEIHSLLVNQSACSYKIAFDSIPFR